MPGSSPGLELGKTYLFEQVGFPAFYGTVVGCEPDLAQPTYVWLNRTGSGGAADPERNPQLVILGTNWIVSPGTPPNGGAEP
jgi:hypothetical protein